MPLKSVQQQGLSTLWSVLCSGNRWNYTIHADYCCKLFPKVISYQFYSFQLSSNEREGYHRLSL